MCILDLLKIYILSKLLAHNVQKPSLDAHLKDPIEDNVLEKLLLLREASQTFHQIASIARLIEVNEEKRIFCSHLTLHCVRFQGCLKRLSQSPSWVDGALINTALSQLSSLISEAGFRELPSSTANSRLAALNTRWYDIRKQEDSEKGDFIRKWLKLDSSEEHLGNIDNALEDCADKLEKQQPENDIGKYGIEISSKDQTKPSHEVWRAAKTLFDALVDCERCPRSKNHEFKVKLELGTYQRPDKTVQTKNATATGKLATCEHDSAGGILDFDMFVTMEREWHQIRIEATKQAYDENRRVKSLCESIDRMGFMARQRLVLKLTSGQLFNVRIEKSNFWIDQATEPISLLECFEERHNFFTEKTKRILSLIIGYAALHLSGTPWLQVGWGSTNINFFRTTSQKTPLRPFIQVHLPKANDIAGNEIDNEAHNNEIFDSGHRCPALIALAVVLIEVYFAKSFYKLAQMKGIPLQSPNSHITLFDVDQVFNGEKENKIEGWRDQIPEYSPLVTAIDNCLNPKLWRDDEGNALDNPTLKSRIYDKAVRLLELHLTMGFSKIPIDNIDNYARGLDFGAWGQPIANHDLQGVTAVSSIIASSPLRLTTTSYTPSPGLTLSASNQVDTQSIMPALQRYRQDSDANTLPSLSYTKSNLGPIPQSEANGYQSHRFLGDEISAEENSPENTAYLSWRSEYLTVYNKFVAEYLPRPSSKSIKIAILDTGVDRRHDAIKAREEAIKARLNCYDESQKNIPDSNGHGTFTASLILDYAPDAELYIIKIADENDSPSADIAAKAINHAIDKWDVDIISMSFGWPSSDFDGYDVLESAIHRAYCKKVLLFAAASNSGGQLGRAYPASNSQVICVHSTDALGNASAFSPTAQRFTLNLATIGESVESAWPTHLCHDKSTPPKSTPPKYVKSRSGTSYATPIMAGIAAFLLQYARIHLSAEEALKFKNKENMEALLKRCAERGPDYAMRDGYFYVELSLHRHNLFGGKFENIKYEISKTLQK